MLGDEAVGQGAIDAGVSAVYGYPGTPSTEIFEYVEKKNREVKLGIAVSWAANEKVAYEQALGVSFAGLRSLVTMKHVGLNVAADPFMNSAITGTEGGLLLAVADDPSMHSSQNEQDSRFYADFAKIICLEPSDQQMAYEMVWEGFEISERFKIPVMLRLTTRISHSRSPIETRSPRSKNQLLPSEERSRWTLLPSNARNQYKKLLDKQAEIRDYCEESPFNQLHLNREDRKLGVIASGIAFNYFMENFQDAEPPSYLRINTYPIPKKKLQKLLDHVEKVLILEEGYPFIERQLLGVLDCSPNGVKVEGRGSGAVPESGELNADIVAQALGLVRGERPVKKPELLKPRPPQFCPGCPHIYTYKAIQEARAQFDSSYVFGDIGCYTLGYYEPYSAIDTCVDMGASISMAKGAADAGIRPVICAIGDSTFAHSGIPALLTAARENTDMTVFILDNRAVAMTGAQESLSTGEDLVQLVRGVGVPEEHIKKIEPIPKKHRENVEIIANELNYPGLSVIIAERPCLWAK